MGARILVRKTRTTTLTVTRCATVTTVVRRITQMTRMATRYATARISVLWMPNDADKDGKCSDHILEKCPNDKENDIDSDGLCHAEDACPYETVNDSDGDKLCDIALCTKSSQVDCSKLKGDPCPLDRQNDVDKDGKCAKDDKCPFEKKDDEDKDGKCAFTVCGQDSPTFKNFAGDSCRSYEPGESNHRYCVKDKVCTECPCACAAQCGDPCPKDAKDDSDGDKVCDSQDSCPKDKLNDSDGDKICDSKDACPNSK